MQATRANNKRNANHVFDSALDCNLFCQNIYTNICIHTIIDTQVSKTAVRLQILRMTFDSNNHNHCLFGSGCSLLQTNTVDTNTNTNIVDFLNKFEGGSVDLVLNDATGIAHLIINYPERKNAFSGRMMVDFRKAIERLEQWKQGRAVFMFGSTSFFSSGGDLKTVKQILNNQQGEQMSLFMSENLGRFQALALISVALIEGKAIGGGAELITCCDYRLATMETRIGFVHRKMGITTGWGGGTRLVHIVGRNKALDLLLKGNQLTALEAKSIGLVDDVLPSVSAEHELVQLAANWLSKRIDGPIEPLHAIKQMIHLASISPLPQALSCELALLKSVWGQDAHQKALQANIKHRL